MFKVVLYKDKITSTTWDEKNQTWNEYDISKESGHFTKYFNRVVEIKEDVTVEDFMLHLERYEVDIDYCFAGYTNGIPLRLYLDEMKKEPEGEVDLEIIELYWVGEILEEDLVVAGVLRGWLDEIKAKESGRNLDMPNDTVDCMPINIWKNCKLELNENILIRDLGEIKEIKETLLFDGFYKWTLHEVISNFLSELTASGSPEERNKLMAQIVDKTTNLPELSKDKEQANFWLAVLESDLEDSRDDMNKALDDENYEKASKLKVSIATIEKEIELLKSEMKKNKTDE